MSFPSDYLTDFLDEMQALVTTTLGLPTPPAGEINVLTTVQGTKHSFVEMLRGSADVTFTLPGVILDVGDFKAQSGDIAMNTTNVVRVPFTCVYIVPWGGATGNDQNAAFRGIMALKNVIDDPTLGAQFNTFYRIELGMVLSNVDAPVNLVLSANSQVDLIAASLSYSPGLLGQLY